MNQNALESNLIKREAISMQIAAKLRQDIFEGKYKPGDKLPPEREIGETYGISRVTVRQALQEMAREEWIEIVQGRGATVLDFSRRVGLDILPSLLTSTPAAVVNAETFRTMHDFSNWLYMQICVSASKRASIGDERKLIEIINRYKEGYTARDYFRNEGDFFYELLDIGGNLVLRMFFNMYMKTFQRLVDTGVFQAPPLPRELYIDLNTELTKAICRNKPEKIMSVIEQYKPNIQLALGSHLKMFGIDIFGEK